MAPSRAALRRAAARGPRAYLGEPAAGPRPAPVAALNQLEALKKMSRVVADTGEIDQYRHFLDEAVAEEAAAHGGRAVPSLVADRVSVKIGAQMLQEVPGRVSTEVAARLSHDTGPTVDKALHLLELYASLGVDPGRVYIKIASTWEGIRACEALSKQGIACNMTLLFSFAQAAACADAGAALISPFVGRILDWHRAQHGGREYAPHEDPGVLSVRRIYSYFKRHDYNTTVMAASFRSAGEVRALAGCDAITVSPALLKELEAATDPLEWGLWPGLGAACADERVDLGAGARAAFDRLHGGDAMAVDKLAEGIEGFAADQERLEALIEEALQR